MGCFYEIKRHIIMTVVIPNAVEIDIYSHQINVSYFEPVIIFFEVRDGHGVTNNIQIYFPHHGKSMIITEIRSLAVKPYKIDWGMT